MKLDNPKMNKPLMITAAILTCAGVTFLFQNCAKTKIGDLKDTDSVNQQAVILNGKQLISVTNATGEQCPSGGKVYAVYTDDNDNLQLDPGETVLSSQAVCNGATGATGATGAAGSNAMISMNRITVELNVCPSTSGVMLSTGTDTNNNGTLDSAEITQTTVLCDGATGETGATGAGGPPGSNGHSVVFSVVPAIAEICPNGGTVILMALDVNDNGVYTAALPMQQSATICNGMNGMSAPASPYQIVDAIKACGETVANKEIILRLENGQLLATVSDNVNGYNTRLAFVVDGNYVNTDPSGCTFSITTQNKTRSISWGGQVQVSWQMP